MIIPVRDHILIEVARPVQESKTQSGIILKQQIAQRQSVGTVLAFGQGRLLENGSQVPSCVSIGDKIIFYDYAGVMINYDNQEANKDYLIIKQNDVIAIVKHEGDAGGII